MDAYAYGESARDFENLCYAPLTPYHPAALPLPLMERMSQHVHRKPHRVRDEVERTTLSRQMERPWACCQWPNSASACESDFESQERLKNNQ